MVLPLQKLLKLLKLGGGEGAVVADSALQACLCGLHHLACMADSTHIHMLPMTNLLLRMVRLHQAQVADYAACAWVNFASGDAISLIWCNYLSSHSTRLFLNRVLVWGRHKDPHRGSLC